MDELREAFLRGYKGTGKSISTYFFYQKIFIILGNNPSIKTTADLVPSIVPRFIKDCPTRSEDRKKRLLCALRRACQFAVDHGHLAVNPVPDDPICPPARRRSRPLPEPGEPDKAEIKARVETILTLLKSRSDQWSSHRLLAMVATIVYTGLTKSEALLLETSDFDPARRTLRIACRHRFRSGLRYTSPDVSVPEELARIYADWIPKADSRWIFPAAYGTAPWDGQTTKIFPATAIPALAGKRLWEIKAIGLECGIPDLSYDLLRRYHEAMVKPAPVSLGLDVGIAAEPVRPAPSAAEPATGRVPMVVKRPDGSYRVRGEMGSEVKTLKTKAQRRLVDFLLGKGEAGPTTRGMQARFPDYARMLKDIRSDAVWEWAIVPPNDRGRKGDHWHIRHVDAGVS